MKIKPPNLLKLLSLTVSCCCFGSFAQAAINNEAIEVPFNFYRNAIIVQAKVNGKGPFNMLLDTEADPSVIDLKMAKEIGLKLASVGQQGTGGGTDTNLAYETNLPLLELGGLTARNVEAVAINLSKMSAALGKPLHAVLGHNLLKNRIVQIDYPKRVVRFYAASPFRKPTHRTHHRKLATLSFRYRDDILMEGVSANGKRMAANLDTGSNGRFQLTPAAVVKLGLETQVGKARVRKSAGFNGMTENWEGKIKNVTIGGVSIDGPTIVFYGKGAGRDKESWGIRIGNAFLKDFIVTINYQSDIVMLEKP